MAQDGQRTPGYNPGDRQSLDSIMTTITSMLESQRAMMETQQRALVENQRIHNENQQSQRALIEHHHQYLERYQQVDGDRPAPNRKLQDALRRIPKYDYDDNKEMLHGSWRTHVENMRRWYRIAGIENEQDKMDYLTETISLEGQTKLKHVLNPAAGMPEPRTFEELAQRANSVFEKAGMAQVAKTNFQNLVQGKLDLTTYLHTKHNLYIESLESAGLGGQQEAYNLSYLCTEALAGLNAKGIAEKVIDSENPIVNYQQLIDRVAHFVGKHQFKVNARLKEPLSGADGRKKDYKSGVEPMDVGQISGTKKPAVTCHNCGKKGHYARKCQSGKKFVKSYQKNQAGNTGKKRKETRKCFRCHKVGHLKEDC